MDVHDDEIGSSPEDCVSMKWKRCEKNPGHKDFIPVTEFTSSHLPECYRNKHYEYIKATSDLTVKLSVNYISKLRPDGYIFSDLRGTRVKRVGSGYFKTFDTPGLIDNDCVPSLPRYEYKPESEDIIETSLIQSSSTDDGEQLPELQECRVIDLNMLDDDTKQDVQKWSERLHRFFLTPGTYSFMGGGTSDEDDLCEGKAAGAIIDDEGLKALYNERFEFPRSGHEIDSWEAFIAMYKSCHELENRMRLRDDARTRSEIEFLRKEGQKMVPLTSRDDSPLFKDMTDDELRNFLMNNLRPARFFLTQEAYKMCVDKDGFDGEDVPFEGKAAGAMLDDEGLRALYEEQINFPIFGETSFPEIMDFKMFTRMYRMYNDANNFSVEVSNANRTYETMKETLISKQENGSDLQTMAQTGSVSQANVRTNVITEDIDRQLLWTAHRELMYPKKVDQCLCPECEGLKRTGYLVAISTALHVVFNNGEARRTIVEVFYDTPEAETKKLYGLYIKCNMPIGDSCALVCATHDLELVQKLEYLLKKRFDTKYHECDETDPLLAIVISHPHGNFKHIGIGNWRNQKICGTPFRQCYAFTNYEYTAATCPGSSGGPVIILGHPKKTNQLTPGLHPHHGRYTSKVNKCSFADDVFFGRSIFFKE